MTFDEYAEAVDDKWKDAFLKTWETIETHLPPGFEVAVYRHRCSKKTSGSVPYGDVPRTRNLRLVYF